MRVLAELPFERGVGIQIEDDGIPATIPQIEEIADLLGFEVEFDNDGQVVLYTSVYAKELPNPDTVDRVVEDAISFLEEEMEEPWEE